MKPLWVSTGVVALLLGPVGSSEAQDDTVYLIPELTDEQVAMLDLKDGSIEDWSNLVGEPTLSGVEFYPVIGNYDPASFDFRFWLGWHDTSDWARIKAGFR